MLQEETIARQCMLHPAVLSQAKSRPIQFSITIRMGGEHRKAYLAAKSDCDFHNLQMHQLIYFLEENVKMLAQNKGHYLYVTWILWVNIFKRPVFRGWDNQMTSMERPTEARSRTKLKSEEPLYGMQEHYIPPVWGRILTSGKTMSRSATKTVPVLKQSPGKRHVCSSKQMLTKFYLWFLPFQEPSSAHQSSSEGS